MVPTTANISNPFIPNVDAKNIRILCTLSLMEIL